MRLVLEECAGVPVTDDQTALVFSGRQLASRRGGDCRQPLSRAFLPAGVRAERRRRPGARIGPQHRAVSSAGRARIHAGSVHAIRRTSPGGRSESRRRIGSRVSPPLERLRQRRGSRPRIFSRSWQIDATVGLRELTTGPAVAGTARHGAVRIWQPSADARDPRRPSGRRARGDEGEAPARPPAAGRPQPFSEGLELRRTRRGFSGETSPSTPRFRSKKTLRSRTGDSRTGPPCCAMSGQGPSHLSARASANAANSFAIRLAHEDTIFRMPLNGDREGRARLLDPLNDAVFANGRHDQILAFALDRLVVPRIDIVSTSADDLSQAGVWAQPKLGAPQDAYRVPHSVDAGDAQRWKPDAGSTCRRTPH